ncbi:cytochrome P450 [Roridomyces roridus]|uniref:Cytochrome P450 n=1 Tax=Roridomyces roridus TaxID=1738132 RepID=A0AAD7FPF4_9AGAR|nr:cytochrome P450 [Roridomyces roridus]
MSQLLPFSQRTDIRVLGSILVIGAVFVSRAVKNAWKARKLPPGPMGVPLLGNLLQLLGDKPWNVFDDLHRKYGDIVHLDLAGEHWVIISNHKIACDLLDRRASIYSDRARSIVAGELLCGGMIFGFTQHNEIWKRMRRGAHEALNNQKVRDYFPFQERESVLLISQFLKSPNLAREHFSRAAVSLVISIMYGRPPLLDSHDPDIVRINEFTHRTFQAMVPGAFLVEFLTWMEHLPRWMTPWRRWAEGHFKQDSKLFERLFGEVKDRVDAGDETSSVAATLIQDQEKLGLSSHEAAWVAASLYSAGSDTSAAQMEWFILAMVLFPSVQSRAQSELDRVVGRDRMPTFADYQHLPYIRALVKELLRWRSINPFSIPHRLCQDDWYEGRWLPKDTICVVNIWALNRDKAVYGEDADELLPERHLDADGQLPGPFFEDTKDENHHAFGFGRRICSGRHVANNSMFMQIACLLWAFDFALAPEADGKLPSVDDVEDSTGTVRPKSFPCAITPRHVDVEGIVAQTKELLGF